MFEVGFLLLLCLLIITPEHTEAFTYWTVGAMSLLSTYVISICMIERLRIMRRKKLQINNEIAKTPVTLM